MIKMTANEFMKAFACLTTIIQQDRPLSMKGAFYIQRLHRNLFDDYKSLADKFNQSIVDAGGEQVEGMAEGVLSIKDPDARAAWEKAWDDGLGSQVLEFKFAPVSVSNLSVSDSVPSCISAGEFGLLGAFITG